MILEIDLCQKMGIPRSELVQRRKKLNKDIDWILDGKRQVCWTESGIGSLGLQEPAVCVIEDVKTECDAVVTRTGFRNKRLIEVSMNGIIKTVLVRDSAVYLAGQEMKVRANGDGWMEARKPLKKGHF